MRIRLSEERRVGMIRSLRQYFAEHFDEELSDFRAEGLLDPISSSPSLWSVKAEIYET